MIARKNHDRKSEPSDNQRYIDSMHRLGRCGMVGAILVMLGMPTVLGIYFDSLPSIGQIVQAALPLLIVFLPSNLFEVISYTPILGSSIYLTLMSGEVLNLKLPVVNCVFEALDIETGTVDADVISSIAVSVASLLVMVVVAVGIALAIPLQPLLTLPAVETAANNLFPAVLGALLVSMLLANDLGGNISARGRWQGLVLPLLALVLLTLFDPQISTMLRLDQLLGQEGHGVIMNLLQGFVILAVLPITYFGTKWLYKKGKIEVKLRDKGNECTKKGERSENQL